MLMQQPAAPPHTCPMKSSLQAHSLIHNTYLLQPGFHLCKLTIGIQVQWNGHSLVTHLIYINIHHQQIIFTKIGRTSKTCKHLFA